MPTAESTVTESPAIPRVDRIFRTAVLDRLARLELGVLDVVDADGPSRFGAPTEDGLAASLRIHNPRFYRSAVLGGSLGAAESYIAGDWDSADLTSVIRLLARNREASQALERGPAVLAGSAARLLHRMRRNSRSGSRRNILAHYDLGNGLFEHFLDPSMTYSSAFFEEPSATLEEAQTAKIDRLCRKLQLGPGDHLLEIGTGWGSLAIRAAGEYGCRVTTTTISPSQHREASRRVAAAGLADRVRLEMLDYRELEGRYDKLVSVEMIEAVGHENFDDFFAACSRRLRPGGLMALQAITIADRNYDAARKSVDFIQRHIFPGGALPSVSAMTASIASSTDLTPHHLEDMGLHYAETLRRWRDRFEAEWPAIETLGFDDRFRRLWRYYLCYCEGGFLERVIGVVQMVLAKPGFRGDSIGAAR